MKCFEIDEAFPNNNQQSDSYVSAKGESKPIPVPLSANQLAAAEAKAKRQKLLRMAAIMQAKKLNAEKNQATTDDIAMAFRLANS